MGATFRSDVRAIADAQSARIDAQMGQMRAELRQEIGQLRGEMRTGLADLKSELLRWMFLFWVGSIGSVLLLLKL